MSKFIRLTINKPSPAYIYNKVYIGIIASLLGFLLVFCVSRQEAIKAQLHAWKLLPEPETLTELYFEDHLKLPNRVEKNHGYPFRFTIHNLEYRDITYPYEISAIEDGNRAPFATGSVSLKHDEYKIIEASFSASREYYRTQIEVNLVGRNQPIHFWMDGKITPTLNPAPTGAGPIITPITKTTPGLIKL